MLIGNGLLINKVPLALLGDRWNGFVRDDVQLLKAAGTLGSKTAIPSGYGVNRAISAPMKASGLNSHKYCFGSSTASLSMQSGWNISGLAEGSTPTSQATLQLVVSMVASALGEATNNANLRAALGLAGSSAGVTTNNAVITALAWAIGNASGEATATLVRYATGQLQGSISPFTELSPEGLAAAVWNSLVAQYGEDGTMGNALGLASSGGVDYSTLAAAILSAAQTTPIHSDVRKVTGITVTGTGTESDPWGP